MTLSAFADKAVAPDLPRLRETLGSSFACWIRLTEDLQRAYGSLAEEWNFSGKAYGWSYRLRQKKRVLIYMTPCEGHFLASFVLGEKACEAARQARLPASVLDLIAAARPYAEGRGIRLAVHREQDLHAIRQLAAIKVAH